jgi:hypothetical protein
MHTLRNSKLIAKLVLVWFALFLGSAIASTVIKPDSLQMVCTASGGMKMVDMTGDDGELKASASMDCPLWLTRWLALAKKVRSMQQSIIFLMPTINTTRATLCPVVISELA